MILPCVTRKSGKLWERKRTDRAGLFSERMICRMLKRFSVKNYKNFRDEISIDFENTAGYQFGTDCIVDDMICKMLIYGRNATGKTNLGRALVDIRYTVVDMTIYRQSEAFLNADSTEAFASFCYVFQLEDQELVYKYDRISDRKLGREELIVNGIVIYRCDFKEKKYDFHNLEVIGAETANIDRYLQVSEGRGETDEAEESELPLLRWLISNVAFNSDSVLIKLYEYIGKMIIITVGNNMMLPSGRIRDSFYESLEKTDKLRDLEDFLNAMGIECRLVLKKLPDGQRELYFSHDKLIPFYENASSGTRALLEIYRKLISRVRDAAFIYLDEFDAFYHYEMAENVIRFFKKRYPKTQIIMTTHNTNLMTNRLMRPDCVFILSKAGSLTALCDATQRELREGHNLEKMYISGEFERYE